MAGGWSPGLCLPAGLSQPSKPKRSSPQAHRGPLPASSPAAASPLSAPCPGRATCREHRAGRGAGRWVRLQPALCSPPNTDHTYRAIITPATPVCMARLASSYDKTSPFPEGQRLGGLRELGASGSSRGGPASPVTSPGAGQGPRGGGQQACGLWEWGWRQGTHRTGAWDWLPSHTARCTPSQPAWCSAAPGSGRGAEGEATRGEGETGREAEDQTQRKRPREIKRDRLRETERRRDRRRQRRRESQRAGGRSRERETIRKGCRALLRPPRPPCPETHRDQGCTPVPQLREQAVCQVHTLLDARADLHRQRHVQHLRRRRGSAGRGVRPGGGGAAEGVPGSCRGRSAGTWLRGS